MIPYPATVVGVEVTLLQLTSLILASLTALLEIKYLNAKVLMVEFIDGTQFIYMLNVSLNTWYED